MISTYGDSAKYGSQVPAATLRPQYRKVFLAELKPGGLHLMLMGGKAALQEGQRVPLLLGLSDGSEVRGELVVRKP